MPRQFIAVMRCIVGSAVLFMVFQKSPAEPIIIESRDGGTSVIRITTTDRDQKVYRIDLSQRHSPASEQTALLNRWESYRFGAFVCFNTNQFSGIEI